MSKVKIVTREDLSSLRAKRVDEKNEKRREVLIY